MSVFLATCFLARCVSGRPPSYVRVVPRPSCQTTFGMKETRNSFPFLKKFKMKKKENRVKTERITLRLEKDLKSKWLKICEEKNMKIQDFLISSVENNLMKSEKREVLKFIEIQSNIFAKIENNFNQIARMVNTEKKIDPTTFNNFLDNVKILKNLKAEQNNLFRTIIKLLGR